MVPNAAIGVDLALDRMDVADRRIVEMAPPDERHQRLQERPARRGIAGHRARLDHGRAFPVLAVALVVDLGVVDRQGEGMPRRMRSEPQVGAEDVAVLGLGLQEVDEAARQPDAERHRALGPAIAQPLGVEEHDQVDVARVVQLAGAELAHAEDEHTRGVHRCGLDLAAASALREQMGERALDRAVGQIGERLGDLLERPQAGEVAQTHQERVAAAGAAQAGHQPGSLRGRHGGELRREHAESPVRTLLAQQPQHARLGTEHLGEERAAREQGTQEIVVASGTRSDERGEVRIRRHLAQMQPALEPALGELRLGHQRWRQDGVTYGVHGAHSWPGSGLDRLRGRSRSTQLARRRHRLSCARR